MVKKQNRRKSEGIVDKEDVKKMNLYRKTGIIVGVLFLIDLMMNMIGSSLIESILDTPDYLVGLSVNRSQVITGVLLETIGAACLVSIGFIIYPVLKRHGKTAARGYFGIRIVETVIAISFVISHLLLLVLSQEFVGSGSSDASHFHTLGALLIEGHDFSYQIYLIFYALGCLILFGVLYKARLVPRFISVWGLLGVVISLTGLMFDMYGYGISMEMYAMPLGLCQIFLAVWLIVKGFNPLAFDSGSAVTEVNGVQTSAN
jgi:hypothetical protein